MGAQEYKEQEEIIEPITLLLQASFAFFTLPSSRLNSPKKHLILVNIPWFKTF